MKKYGFLVFHGDYHKFVSELGKMGVLHVIERKSDNREESLIELTIQHKELLETYGLLQGISKEYDNADETLNEKISAEEITEETRRLQKQLETITATMAEMESEIDRMNPWGNFDLSDIQGIEEAGYRILFFQKPIIGYDPSWAEKYNLFEINRSGNNVWFVIVTAENQEVDIDAEQVKPVMQSLSTLQEELQVKKEEKQALTNRLASIASGSGKILEEKIKWIESELALKRIYLDTLIESGDTLHILEGWVPEEWDSRVTRLAEDSGAVSVAIPPSESEMPPVKLKNSHFSRLFEPISRLFDLPNYGELDLTPYFAPFFMIFFGFCLGDAGYGVFFILLGTLLKLKLRKKKSDLKPVLTLAQYFGVATILFGLLSGTFFGMNLIDSGYTLTSESIEMLRNEGTTETVVLQLQEMEGEYYKNRSDFSVAVEKIIGENSTTNRVDILKSAEAGIPFIRTVRHLMQEPLNMFYLALVIGALQIMFGIFVKVLNISRRKGFRYALSPVGWLLLLISLLLYTGGFFEGTFLKFLFYSILTVSGLFILVFNKPGRGILSRIGGGLWDSYGMVTGLFGDLLSYIRLFALGISSAILGFVFNDISLQLLNIPWIGWLFFLIILVAGHSINLFLATLGGFIHPMRLTFVEFYKNAGFEGGGKEYKPFIVNN